MADFLFRDATLNDLERIVEIYNSTVPSGMVTADTEPVTIESRIEWFNVHIPNKRPLWVIDNGKANIAGWISLQSFYGRPAYDSTVEVSIYLDANERGKGLGRLALQYCIDKAPELGVNTLLGFIFSHNEPSLKLFRSFGFEDWALLPGIATLDGIDRSLTIVGK